MSKKIQSQIQIKAAPKLIWSVLTDFKNYPEWNPFIISLIGKVEPGNTILVRIQPPKSKPMTFKPTILSRIENKELSWLGKFMIPGVFDGLHKFELIPNPDGTTTFVHLEEFSGILSNLLNLNKTEEGFKLMNQKLKERVESLNRIEANS
ncbi:MAG: SRPBCC domain-containing protein [Flavobacteriaceae bacterium]|nr:SRPBCC domain-containing protein [Flavobacteriaceae bacterium]